MDEHCYTLENELNVLHMAQVSACMHGACIGIHAIATNRECQQFLYMVASYGPAQWVHDWAI